MNTSMYSQAAFETAQQAQMTEREAALSSDPVVRSARQKLANAQASLEQLQNQTRTLPYEQRVRYLNDIAASKQAVTDAQKELRTAENNVAGARYAAKLQAKQAEQAEQQKQAEAQHAMLEEAAAKAEHKPSYLASGGTAEQFEAAWPGMWQKQLEQRAVAQVAAKHQALKHHSVYSLL